MKLRIVYDELMPGRPTESDSRSVPLLIGTVKITEAYKSQTSQVGAC